jgi:hypothetical protein
MIQFLDFPLSGVCIMFVTRLFLAAFCLFASTLYASAQTKYALLIGIDTYHYSETSRRSNYWAFCPGRAAFWQSYWSHLRRRLHARGAYQQ